MKKVGLAPHTGKIIDKISLLECIKPFVLVGGTALSIQLQTRQSEDLDFQRWKTGKDDALDIGWNNIQSQLATVGEIQYVDVFGFDQVSFVISDVKVSFYAAPRKRIPTMQEVPYLNNIRLADIESIGIMKMEALMRRSKFRDYYDIYSILKNGADINRLITGALQHSEHKLKKKSLMMMLTNGQLFRKDEQFKTLQPVYDVNAIDIQEYIKALLIANK